MLLNKSVGANVKLTQRINERADADGGALMSSRNHYLLIDMHVINGSLRLIVLLYPRFV